VAIHVIEELLDALEDVGSEDVELDCEALEEIVMAVGRTVHVDQTKRTMKLCGTVGKKEVLILVDSGSVASFISPQLDECLQLVIVPCPATTFLAADGSPMECARQVKELMWEVQGHTFTSTVGILPLKCFDMIVGEDWLEDYSPMWIQWANKIMRFTHLGKRVELKGIKQQVSHCTAISAMGLQQLFNREAVQHCVQFKWDLVGSL